MSSSRTNFATALLLGTLTSARWNEGVPKTLQEKVESGKPPMTFLLGVQKSGSTSLFCTMAKWPGFCAGHASKDEPAYHWKEKHFFGQHGSTDLNSTVERFPNYVDLYSNCAENDVRMDGTPHYFCDGKIPSLIHDTYQAFGYNVNNLKFVVILRDPVPRTVSAYEHGLRGNWRDVVNKTFDNIVTEGVTMYEEKLLDMENKGMFQARCHPVLTGVYHLQFKNWFKMFQPKQFIIVTLSQLVKEPEQTLAAIGKHIGLEPSTTVVQHNNEGGYQDEHPVIPQELVEFFEPHNKALDQLRQEHPEAFYDVPGNKFSLEM